ncbi:Secreted RxLR effector peptide protein [Phytophthora palmivora]|uniref:Secreted RxLR effector peptide protein n=1 Tax=Phytophthora palmivora TaxID=4796 RepID=A0A2P4YLF5_9STRA|nr:Secreted RxLR effector peptide protein [Phytophthora palmivora]
MRFLRYIPDDEERGIAEKVDDAVTKLDDIAGKGKGLTPKWNALFQKNLDEFSGKTALANKLSNKYDNTIKMSMSTLKQLDDVETRRVKDIVRYSKETGASMHRVITPFPGMKTAPKKLMVSHVGRNNQRYGPDGSRLLSAAVVSRPKNQGGGDVLLISSSNPNKGDWLLPKGGWDKGEDVERAALREVMEEGGLLHNLGVTKFSEGEKKYTYYSYMMKSNTVYDDWAESARYRIWVSYDEAILLLGKRKHMVNVVEEAKKVAEKIKARNMPEADKDIQKITLNLE